MVLLAASGCQSHQKARFNPPYGVHKSPILAVPFSEPRRYRWYGESGRGFHVAEAFKTWVMSNASPNFPEGPRVDEALDTVRNWKEDFITIDDWQQITATVGVKYVLYGEIEDLSLQKPNTIGILDASIRASYRVIDLEEERTVWKRNSLTLQIEDKETDAPMVALGADTAALERQLLAKLGRQIGQDLYGYTR
jgi:hypothetical protein